MSQQQQHLSGAVVLLALSIVTLAAVLAGIERGRSQRDPKDCHQCASAVTAAPCAERSPTEACATAPSAGSGAGVETAEDEPLVVGARVPPGAADGRLGDGRAPDPPGLPGRQLEILVHNISHKDMVLSLRRTKDAAKPASPQQRPTGEVVSNVIDAVS